jgi:predicted ATPase/class 3 adenylate cyclase
MGTLPTGTVTFLFTDIEGSTTLAQQHPDHISALLARHNQILDQCIKAHGGFVFRIVGDAYCVAFHNVNDALQAALEVQRQLYAEAWSPAPIKVRMGIHTGAAQLEGESNYSGYATLALSQRIMSAGHGGQVLLSQTVYDLLGDKLSANAQLIDMGERHLKDILQPEHLYQLVVPDLPSEFPPLKTLKTVNHNLPLSLTSFIGRERELAETKEKLEETRLLTLIGPGGTGKTRLSLQVGGEALPDFKDGIWLVELAPLADPNLIPQTVAVVLGLRESPARPLVDLVIDYLRAKQLLLILDNCEHLIDACARLTDQLLRSCPGLKIIASSREALGINGETIYRVPSLSVPEQNEVTREALMGYESAQLFMERASAANPNFQLTNENASSVAQICLRLDGIPLALELAAARARVLSVDQIAERLDDRFRLLTGGSRTALPRQQTLQALIDWSYDLLTEPEQALFRRLAVFVGGWTLEAAEKVCSDEIMDEYEVLDLLTQLVDKSLVITEEDNGVVRYYRLETIRQYAREKLLETDEALTIRNRHLDYFIQLSEWATLNWFSPKQKEVEHRIITEQANYRAALAWAMENQPEQALQLISWGIFVVMYLFQGYITEAKEWIYAAVDKIEKLPPADGEEALVRKRFLAIGYDYVASVEMNQGNHQASRIAARKSLELAREINDQPLVAQALASLGIGESYSGDPEKALAVTQEAISICRQLGLKYEHFWALTTMNNIYTVNEDYEGLQKNKEAIRRLEQELGVPINPAVAERELSTKLFMQGKLADALEHAEKSFSLFEEQNDKYTLTFFMSEVAHVLRRRGDLDKALHYYRKSILLWRDFGHRAAVAHQLECFALIALTQGQNVRATELFSAADNLRGISHSIRTPLEQDEFEEAKSKLKSVMDEAEFDISWYDGRLMTMEQAITFALDEK